MINKQTGPLLLREAILPFEEELRETKIDLRKVSKLLKTYKGEELAFVDIVVEGGGVKGIAISGALFALEEMGVRFRKIAGTSAGAMNASILGAAGWNIADKKSERLANIVFNMDLLRFVDGGKGAQAFIHAIMSNNHGIIARIHKLISFARNIAPVFKNYGVNPGKTIHHWLQKLFKRLNSGEDLTVEDIELWHMQGVEGVHGELQLVVTDITNRRKAIFPRDLHLYFKEPQKILIADIVRASLSIPIFFEPMKLRDFNYNGEFVTGSKLIINGDTTFVDGALVSNFPLGLFDIEKDGNPVCPTFGLVFDNQDEAKSHTIHSIFDFTLAMLETLNEHGDRSYLFQEESSSRCIKISNHVDNKKIKTIYFNLTREEMKKLFGNGVRAGIDFLKTWDFENYILSHRTKKNNY